MSSPRASRSELTSTLTAVAAVAATYAYFLLFAQFGFLRLLQERLGDSSSVRLAMLAMGLAGFGLSLAAARFLERPSPRLLVRAGFAGCGAMALVSTAALPAAAWIAVSAAVGGFTAVLTVALAYGLRDWLPGRGLGLKVGAATGVAYFVCNFPPLFEASSGAQALFAALACGVGLASTAAMPAAGPPAAEPSPRRRVSRSTARFATILLSFLALVWLDSAAFAVIQQSAALKALTWGSGQQKMLLGAVHLLAAIAAGWLLDRGRLRGLLLATFGLFAVALTLLTRLEVLQAWAGPIYATGISLYSTALVVYAAAGERGASASRWRAALLYGLAGWLGSALGVGMAQDLHTVPTWFLVGAGAVVAFCWRFERWSWIRAAARAYAPALAWALAVTALAATASVLVPASSAEATARESRIARGRQVYISEGCINCHSSFVRCGTDDEWLWGPCGAPADEAGPPLIGTRRQGPDLLNAGNRRSAEWHRLHLEDPRALSPGSRMPSYRHLFDGGSRGEDLVAFLASLGRETAAERFELSQAFPVADPRTAVSRGRGSLEHGARLFERNCAACHGASGRGDGPLELRAARPTAIDLTKGDFWLVPRGPERGAEAEGLARVIRFGVPGTSMPGHEYFSDREIADLVRYVRVLSSWRVASSGVPRGGDGGEGEVAR